MHKINLWKISKFKSNTFLISYSGDIENGQVTWLKSLTQSRDPIENLLTPDEKTAIVLITE